MITSNIFEKMETAKITNAGPSAEFLHRMLQTVAARNTFTPTPSNSSAPPSYLETAVGSIAFQGGAETTGGIGIAKPDWNTSL